MLVCVAAMTAASARAEGQQVDLQYSMDLALPFDVVQKENLSFWGQFKQEFTGTAEQVFADKFHPFNTLTWTSELSDTDFRTFQERSTRAAKSSLSKSVSYGLREAALDLPVMGWFREHDGFLSALFVNSVDSVEEE